jgi:hypothetical protein
MAKSKKAQIMSMETIAVLLVFFIILMFVLIFYFSYRSGAIEEKKKDFYRQQAVEIAVQVTNLPELECTGAGIEMGVDCMDLLKLKALAKLINESIDLRAGIYLEKFGVTKIAVREVYDRGGTLDNYTIYSREPEKKSDTYVFQTAVSLLDPTVNPPIGVRGIGILETTFYAE